MPSILPSVQQAVAAQLTGVRRRTRPFGIVCGNVPGGPESGRRLAPHWARRRDAPRAWRPPGRSRWTWSWRTSASRSRARTPYPTGGRRRRRGLAGTDSSVFDRIGPLPAWAAWAVVLVGEGRLVLRVDSGRACSVRVRGSACSRTPRAAPRLWRWPMAEMVTSGGACRCAPVGAVRPGSQACARG